jgi:hypothetical protein
MTKARPLITEENSFEAQCAAPVTNTLTDNTSVCHKADKDMEPSACADLVVVTDLDFE